MLDHGVGGAEDVAGGPVVLLEFDHLGAGKVALEVKDVAQVGASPSVDRLVVVADHAQVAMGCGQFAQQQVLGGVGVLVLVDHQITETLLVFGQHLGKLFEQAHGEHDDVVEVDGVVGLERLLVARIDGGGHVLVGVAPAHGEVFRSDQAVLGVRDHPEDAVGIELLSVEMNLLLEVLDQAHLVGGAVDGKVLLVTEPVDVLAQQTHAQGVKGRDDHALAAPLADQLLDAFLHLASRLVGEGHCQDILRRHFAPTKQPGDALGDDPRLAGSGAGQDQQRPLGVLHRLALFLVQSGQIHRLRLSRSPLKQTTAGPAQAGPAAISR